MGDDVTACGRSLIVPSARVFICLLTVDKSLLPTGKVAVKTVQQDSATRRTSRDLDDCRLQQNNCKYASVTVVSRKSAATAN